MSSSKYPRLFWLIAFGVLLSSAGSSLIWPFQLIYISKELVMPLTGAATLISLSSIVGLLISFAGGAIADRFGRKPLMVVAQAAHGVAYLLMTQAHGYLGFLFPMILMGASMPLYAIGSDAMMADIILPEHRSTAFSILRMTNNAGIAIGPAIGGYLVTRSYGLAFLGAALAMLTYSTILLFFSKETLKRKRFSTRTGLHSEVSQGYRTVFKDRLFIGYVLSITLGMIAPLMMWTLLAVYTNQNFHIAESQYSLLPITNALMCVFIQYFITLLIRRHRPASMIALGMFVYALGVGSVALMSTFTGFWISMVILTFGELILIPTGTTFAANRAPAELRGRYMSIYYLTWGVARSLAPLIGGLLNDAISPGAIWIGGFAFGIASTVILYLLSLRRIASKLSSG